MDGRTDAHTDNVKTVYPTQTKFAGGGGGGVNKNSYFIPPHSKGQ